MFLQRWATWTLRFKTTAEQTSHLNKFNFKPLVPDASRIAHISCNLQFTKIDDREITTKNKERKKQKKHLCANEEKVPLVRRTIALWIRFPIALSNCATNVVT